MDIIVALLNLMLIGTAGLIGASVWLNNGGTKLQAVFVMFVAMLATAAVIDIIDRMIGV